MLSKQAAYRSFEDEELVNRMMIGDKLAFDEIYNRYWKKLYDDTYKRLKRAEQVEEIIQDVFADLWVKRAGKEIIKLYPYLLMSVRYHVFAIYRKGKTAPQFEEPLENMAFSSLQADSLLNEKELKGCIAIWLSMQPLKRGEIFRMKYVDEMSTREISELLGIAQKTVQNQLLTAFASLREFVTKMMMIFCLT